MKDYPDKMTVEQARRFGEDVLNIVSQIPRGKVTTYGYICAGGVAEPFADGGADFAVFAWSRQTALPSGGEQGGAYGSRVESAANFIGRGRGGLQEQWACGYAATPLGAVEDYVIGQRCNQWMLIHSLRSCSDIFSMA